MTTAVKDCEEMMTLGQEQIIVSDHLGL